MGTYYKLDKTYRIIKETNHSTKAIAFMLDWDEGARIVEILNKLEKIQEKYLQNTDNLIGEYLKENEMEK